MRIPRIYQAVPLAVGQEIQLDGQAAVHVTRVLRLREGDTMVLFNGQGGEYHGIINRLDKRVTTVQLQSFVDPHSESPLRINLAQGISRGERMDYTVQKAVELGVYGITPLETKRTVVNLNPERKERRRHHWQSVVQSACEQCGRNFVPLVTEVTKLGDWLHRLPVQEQENRFVLNHRVNRGVDSIQLAVQQPITVLIGPEGGLAEQEIAQAEQAGFVSLRIGPRVLRTETAALAFISVLQAKWGDFG